MKLYNIFQRILFKMQYYVTKNLYMSIMNFGRSRFYVHKIY